MNEEQIQVKLNTIYGRLAEYRKKYEDLSNLIDMEGYMEKYEKDIQMLLDYLSVLREDCNEEIKSRNSNISKGGKEFSFFVSYGSECTDLIRHTENLRERKRSIFTVDNEYDRNLQNDIRALFADMFKLDWMKKYCGADSIEKIVEKGGIKHPLLQRGKHEKMLSAYMMETQEFDLMIVALILYCISDDVAFSEREKNALKEAIGMIRISLFEKTDVRMIKAAAVKYTIEYESIMKKAN